jgi:hypothetical protein
MEMTKRLTKFAAAATVAISTNKRFARPPISAPVVVVILRIHHHYSVGQNGPEYYILHFGGIHTLFPESLVPAS